MNTTLAASGPVVQVVQHLRPGGLETLVLELQSLMRETVQTVVVSLEGDCASALAAWPRLAGVHPLLRFIDKPPGWSPRTFVALWRLFRRLKPRAVHTHHVGPLLYGGLAARLAGVPRLLHTEHDAWHLEDPRRRRLQAAALRALNPVVVADSELVATRMRELLPGCDPLVIRNGVDTLRFSPGERAAARRAFGLPEHAPIVGCAARLHPVKNHAALLRAVAALPDATHLALAGIGELEHSLRAEAGALGIGGRVHFLGLVDDMPAFYRALDVFCLPSHAEGMPLSPLEAQSCGIPVVATRVGGTPETVCENSGALVRPGDEPALRGALRRCLERSSAFADPRSFVLRHGSAQRMIDAYQELLVAEVA